MYTLRDSFSGGWGGGGDPQRKLWKPLSGEAGRRATCRWWIFNLQACKRRGSSPVNLCVCVCVCVMMTYQSVICQQTVKMIRENKSFFCHIWLHLRASFHGNCTVVRRRRPDLFLHPSKSRSTLNREIERFTSTELDAWRQPSSCTLTALTFRFDSVCSHVAVQNHATRGQTISPCICLRFTHVDSRALFG